MNLFVKDSKGVNKRGYGTAEPGLEDLFGLCELFFSIDVGAI